MGFFRVMYECPNFVLSWKGALKAESNILLSFERGLENNLSRIVHTYIVNKSVSVPSWDQDRDRKRGKKTTGNLHLMVIYDLLFYPSPLPKTVKSYVTHSYKLQAL